LLLAVAVACDAGRILTQLWRNVTYGAGILPKRGDMLQWIAMATLGTVPLLRWMITLVIAAGFFACPCAQAKSTASVTAAVATPAPAKHACCAAPAEPE
jgi:hypothetical protein